MSKSMDYLILDEFCQYEPTNQEDDFAMWSYKMLESEVRYIRKERKNDGCREIKGTIYNDTKCGL